MENITVIGAGNMGTAISQVVAQNGHNVKIWNWEKETEPLEQISKFRENKIYLPKVKLSSKIKPVYSLKEALTNSEIVFLVLPSSVAGKIFKKMVGSLQENTIVVNCSKGVDPVSFEFVHKMIENNKKFKGRVVTVSGPAVAGQMATGQYTLMNIASKDPKSIKKIKNVLENKHIKLVETDDLMGVEIGGLTKNVYAIILGICDGLGFAQNTKAIFVNLALKEMSTFSTYLGGKRETIYGLAGLGDLVTTGFSQEGRNRLFGEYLGNGKSKEQALKKVKQTIEGINSTKALLKIAKKQKIKLPLAELVYKCINTSGKSNQKKLVEKFLEKEIV